MNDEILVSIVIPVYNVEHYIKECLESIIAQTYKKIEIIIVNDGSTDNSFKICKSFNDSRIKLLDKANGGLSDARNKGVEIATGKYVMFVDSDDIVHPQIVENLLTNIIKYNCDIAGCDFVPFQDGNTVKWNTKDNKICIWEHDEIFQNLVGAYTTQLTIGCCKLYRRDIILTTPYPFGKIHEDEFTAYKIWSKTDKFIYLNQKMYGYRQRRNSITNTYNLKAEADQIEAKKNIFNYYLQNIEDNRSISRAFFLYLRKIELSYYRISCINKNEKFLQDLEKVFNTEYKKYKEQNKFLRMYERGILFVFHACKPIYMFYERVKRGI